MDSLKKMVDWHLEQDKELELKYLEIIESSLDKLADVGEYIIKDTVDSYDKLIQQRKECIERYIKIYSLFFQDEMDISKPLQSLLEKQQKDIENWQKEIAPLVEMLKLDESASDEKTDEVLEMLKNI